MVYIPTSLGRKLSSPLYRECQLKRDGKVMGTVNSSVRTVRYFLYFIWVLRLGIADKYWER